MSEKSVSSAALTTRARAGALASAQAMPTEWWQGWEVMQAVAQSGNRTWVELSSARSTRTRFEPFSAAISTSSSSSTSCRGAIVGLHAHAEFCFFFDSQYSSPGCCSARSSDAIPRTQRPEKGKRDGERMGEGKERGECPVSGRRKDKGCPVVTPLGSSAFF
eukprot:scaffold3361_cov153-Isochrysis_galbana.AAC.1